MQAIYSKYLPATNVRGSRIKAFCERGSVTIGYPYDYDERGAHRHAVDTLLAKFHAEDIAKYGAKAGWDKPYVTGGLPRKLGFAHVFVEGGN